MKGVNIHALWYESGPFSDEAVRSYVVFGLVGIVLGGGYLWAHKGLAAYQATAAADSNAPLACLS